MPDVLYVLYVSRSSYILTQSIRFSFFFKAGGAVKVPCTARRLACDEVDVTVGCCPELIMTASLMHRHGNPRIRRSAAAALTSHHRHTGKRKNAKITAPAACQQPSFGSSELRLELSAEAGQRQGYSCAVQEPLRRVGRAGL